jgi:hypothetical protein
MFRRIRTTSRRLHLNVNENLNLATHTTGALCRILQRGFLESMRLSALNTHMCVFPDMLVQHTLSTLVASIHPMVLSRLMVNGIATNTCLRAIQLPRRPSSGAACIVVHNQERDDESNLSNTAVGDAGCRRLAYTLLRCPKLEDVVLNLHFGGVCDVGVHVLMHGLRACASSIRSLTIDLGRNAVSSAAVHSLVQFVLTTETQRLRAVRFNLSSTTIGWDGVMRLQAMRDFPAKVRVGPLSLS